jgi:large subunit ribosomal protein L29
MEKKKKINKLAKSLREKDVEALKQDLLEAQKNVFALRTQAVTQKLENPRQATVAKRQIARIKTLLRERQIKAQTTAAAK